MTRTSTGGGALSVAGQHARVLPLDGTPVTDSDPSHYFGQAQAAVTLEKSTEGQDADLAREESRVVCRENRQLDEAPEQPRRARPHPLAAPEDAAGCGAPTCAPLWTAQLPGAAGQTSAAGAFAYALVPFSTPATLVALDRATGAVAWTAGFPDLWPGSMTLADGAVHVVSDGALSTFDAAGCGAPTCSPMWTADLGGAAAGGVISGGGLVFQGLADGRVVAFDAAGCGAATCSPLATVTVAGTPRGLVVDGGRLFVTSTSGSTSSVTAFAPA